MSVQGLPQQDPKFSKLRAAIWPIQGTEMKKFLPMGLMMFFILFNYTILRDTKDTLVVGASGAEAISFIKFWGVTPASILFVILYAKLSNVLSKENLFYTCLLPFILFFGAFALVIYPNKAFLHPSEEHVEALKQSIPALRFVFALWGSWSYSIFYIMAELWGSVIVSLLFWQFANEITRTNEAKRFYALFPLLGNIALILSGQTVTYLSNIRHLYPPEVDAWGISLNYMMGAVVLGGLATMIIYWWMNRAVLTDPFYYDAAATSKKEKKEKPKLSMMESFKYLFTSRYLGFIALLVLGYGMAINLVEVTWKSQLKLQYVNENAYSAFMGNFSTFTGIATIALILMGKGIVRRYGWFTGAILTPIILLITGALFYTFVIFRDDLNWLTIAMGITPLFMAVMLGATQNILSKGTKYSLFDPTKEMSYIPLDQELKVKGKAAVDVIGGRLGKSGGAVVQQFLLVATSATATQVTIAPYSCMIMIVVIFAWMFAAGGLSKMYNTKIAEKEKELKAA
ncbi:MAG: NTP/NDP exchange transporter [Alphaproteobacteria bacterium]|nr:NTP/NDP exchange transporter [Alphaproteobacteria bacterium]